MSSSISSAIDMTMSIFLSPDVWSAGSRDAANQVAGRRTNALIVGRRWALRARLLTAAQTGYEWRSHPVQSRCQTIRGDASLDAVRPARHAHLGHQVLAPRSAATAGTVRVRTTNVSINSPAPMVKPIWATV